jgi:hypothetical protein
MNQVLGHELHYFENEKDLRRFESAAFWKKVNPSLHITSRPFSRRRKPYRVNSKRISAALEQVKSDGYFQVEAVIPRADCKKLGDAVLRIVAAGGHPLFAMVYDEFWRVFSRFDPILEPILGKGYRLVGDYWFWCVSPNSAPSGWGPHRDSQCPAPLRDDGRPPIISVWIPFTDAVPTNGCIYVLPTSLDKNVVDPQTGDRGMAVRSLQDVRALPAKAGSVLGWNQHILHWGGRCTKYAPHPRISVGIYAETTEIPSSHSVEALFVDFDKSLPFEKRLGFVGTAIVRYRDAFKFPEHVLRAAASWALPLTN